jgi:hypothetical protein
VVRKPLTKSFRGIKAFDPVLEIGAIEKSLHHRQLPWRRRPPPWFLDLSFPHHTITI